MNRFESEFVGNSDLRFLAFKSRYLKSKTAITAEYTFLGAFWVLLGGNKEVTLFVFLELQMWNSENLELYTIIRQICAYHLTRSHDMEGWGMYSRFLLFTENIACLGADAQRSYLLDSWLYQSPWPLGAHLDFSGCTFVIAFKMVIAMEGITNYKIPVDPKYWNAAHTHIWLSQGASGVYIGLWSTAKIHFRLEAGALVCSLPVHFLKHLQ